MELSLNMEDLALFNGELLPLGLFGPVAPACSSPEQALLSPPVGDSSAGPLDGFLWPSTFTQQSKHTSNDVLSELLNSSSSSAASDELPEAEWLDVRVDLNNLLPSALVTEEAPLIQTISEVDMTSLLEVTQPAEAAGEVSADLLYMLSQLTQELVSSEQQPTPSAARDLPSEPILSPVSLEDVESLLSSEPCSPQPVDSVAEASPPAPEESLLAAHLKAPIPPKRRGRPAPYAKVPSDCKQRKKQQNKDAALRYRIKKKEESLTVSSECDQLEQRNHDLKEKVDTMTREINYLKSLMAEVYKAKGLLNV